MARSAALWPSRWAAGLDLAERLQPWAGQAANTSVIALPRGGVAVAAAVAQRLQLPLGCWAVRKLAAAQAPEYALGALAAGGVVVWNQAAIAAGRIGEAQQQHLVAAATAEVERRQRLFGRIAASRLQGRQLIVVDDGIATGMTVQAALLALRRCQPAALVLAVPVLDRRLVPELSPLVEQLVCLAAVENLRAVGLFYDDFQQLSDDDVSALLETAQGERSTSDQALG